MKSLLVACTCCFVLTLACAQSPIDRVQFFKDTAVIHATIIANFSKLFRLNQQRYTLPAMFVSTLPDSTQVNEPVQLQIRGHFRHSYCYVPPIKIIFKSNRSSVLAPLKSLKLVNECKLSKVYDQYVLKEYLIYKMYNLLTDISFHVRLLQLKFQDSSGRKKPFVIHSFLMEDIKEVAKRNGCVEYEKGTLETEQTDRKQMTLVALFQYMIGNTDWAVSVDHNIRLVVSKTDSLSKPYVVPYDYDYSGLVNTEYAMPDDRLNMESVRQRLYRGFPRTAAELNEAFEIFNQQKENIYAVINQFDLLTSDSKKDMTSYLDDFYQTIKNPKEVKYTFIDNARKE